MIEFVTFLLGLFTGVQEVELAVDPGVAAIQIRLDDRAIADLKGPPFCLSVDFGAELEPHRLVAIARDATGREVGRVAQWMNRSRGVAAASLLVSRTADGGQRRARLAWQAVQSESPERILVTLDGKPLAVSDPDRIELPGSDPRQVHFLRAEVDFPNGVSATADAIFGGPAREEAAAELTAVAVTLTKGARLPGPAAMSGWFAVSDAEPGRDEPTVVAVEEGPAEVVVVLDQTARRPLGDLVSSRYRFGNLSEDAVKFQRARLRRDQAVRILEPFRRMTFQARSAFALYPETVDLLPRDGGLLYLVDRIQSPLYPLEDQRLREAVALAASSATRRDRRRAVVLILGPGSMDASELGMPQLRRYLDGIGVPLEVWGVAAPATAAAVEIREAFGPVIDVSSFGRFEDAVSSLGKRLEQQRIVWLEGIHLPQRVSVTARARDLIRKP